MPKIMIDTDILIDYLRGQSDAIHFVDGLFESPLVCVVTVAELYSGVREGPERARLDVFLRSVEIVDVDETIATSGGLLRRRYLGSHRTGLADALIAAAALARGVPLASLNAKHYPMLTPIVPYRKP